MTVGVSSATSCSGAGCGGSFSYLDASTLDLFATSSTGAYNGSTGATIDLLPPYVGVYFCMKQ